MIAVCVHDHDSWRLSRDIPVWHFISIEPLLNPADAPACSRSPVDAEWPSPN